MHEKPQRARWFLKQWRVHRHFTQDQLAERSGLSKPFISQLERGLRPYNQGTLERLAEVLGTEPASLIMRDPSDPDGLWSIYDQLTPAERAQGVAVLRALKAAKVG
jgi:transcriptional regulator with XRE-family HTH domain